MFKPIERILASGESVAGFKKRLPEIEKFIEPLQPAEISARAQSLHERAGSESLDGLLPEAFALVSAAASEAIGQTPYPEQLIGGQVIASGAIAEMKTGEGKTLTATLPAFLWSLSGKPVHLVTANDYLARRDRDWMKPVFDLLGVTTEYLDPDDSPEERQRKYRAAIVYGTGQAFGFDYLRDQMVKSLEERRQGELGYAMIDEADSILIDEARTPLVISGQVGDLEGHYEVFAEVAAQLEGVEHKVRLRSEGESADTSDADYDYEYDPKYGTVALTERGVARAEEILGVEHLYRAGQGVIINQLQQALKAKELFHRDRDYAVIDGVVKIIDEGTGRVLETRRWNEGLHQAIEAKEGLELTRETQMMASITLPNYFRMYERVAGMTGTALSDAEELHRIYDLRTYEIPTHEPVQRIDHPDLIFKTARGKWKAIIGEVTRLHREGRPVLVGTTSVEKSEALSRALGEAGIEHQVLNASPEHAAREAEIIAEAGRLGAVTVATNMAGRGVDIKLGGDPDGKDSGGSDEEADEVRRLGGLAIIGTERHDSRRIDNQLRGRAGRQGDPGSSCFFISADDQLVRHYSGDRLKRAMRKADPDEPVSGRLISKAVANAQKMVEQQHYLGRKRLLEFDDVLGRQREVVYKRRDEILEGRDISDLCRYETERVFSRLFDVYMPDLSPEEWNPAKLDLEARQILPELSDMTRFDQDPDKMREALLEEVAAALDDREERFGSGTMRHIERQLYIQILDHHWREHIYEMDYLRRGIGLRGIAGVDPLIAYGNEGLAMFKEMLEATWTDFARMLFHTERKSD